MCTKKSWGLPSFQGAEDSTRASLDSYLEPIRATRQDLGHSTVSHLSRLQCIEVCSALVVEETYPIVVMHCMIEKLIFQSKSGRDGSVS